MTPLTVSEARAILAISSTTSTAALQLDEQTLAAWQQIVESARERVALWERRRSGGAP